MDITKVQQRLRDLGYNVIADGINGPQTIGAVKAFQEGHGLEVDGKVGPMTIYALFPWTSAIAGNVVKPGTAIKPYVSQNQTLSGRAMEIAISQDGVRESTGYNDGPAVGAYLQTVGLKQGNSWCMAFVYWCYDRAAKELNVANPLVRTGHCLHQYNNVPVVMRQIVKPEVGDIFIMLIDKKTGAGHTGIVTKVYPDGSLDTIEGNTNNNGSSNGDGVYMRKGRKTASMHGFIRVRQ